MLIILTNISYIFIDMHRSAWSSPFNMGVTFALNFFELVLHFVLLPSVTVTRLTSPLSAGGEPSCCLLNPQLWKWNPQSKYSVNPKLIKELTFHGKGACVSFQGTTLKRGYWPVCEMALCVLLFQGLWALVNNAAAKSWENPKVPAPGCPLANRPSSGHKSLVGWRGWR